MLKDLKKIIDKMPEARYVALFVLSLICFVSLGINYKLAEALQGLTAVSFYCIIKDPNRKKNFFDFSLVLLLVFVIYTIFRPNNFLTDYKITFKCFMAFISGRAVKVFLPKAFPYVLSATGISLAGSFFLSYINGFPASDYLLTRLCLGYKSGPNQLGQVAMSSVLFFITLKENFSKPVKILMYLISFTGVCILVLTESRTAILGLIICSVYWLFNFKRLKCGYTILLFFIVLAGLISIQTKESLERFKASSNLDNAALAQRFIVWEMALDKAKEFNLWGNSSFSKLYSDYITENKTELAKKYPASYKQPMVHSHNVYLGILIKYGVVGAFLALFFVINVIYKAIKYDDIFVKSILILLFAVGMSEDFLHFTYGIFILYFSAGTMIKPANLISEKKNEQD